MELLAPLKPVFTALLLPPASLILLVLIGTALLATGRRAGRSARPAAGVALGLLACLGLWLGSTQGFSRLLLAHALQPPAPLAQPDLERLRAAARQHPGSLAILVLGGGRLPQAPEYGAPDLAPPSLERLRYGVWLARRTHAALAFSGGVGWGQPPDAEAEAHIAARIAREDYALPLRWVEARSRDTRENAEHSVRLLREAGVRHVVLVTHAWHMPRALRFFQAAAADSDIAIEAAGMGYFVPRDKLLLDWLPSSEGLQHNRWVLRELLAWAVQG